MPEDIQRLRCKVNFQALVFVPHIRDLGNALVSRLRYPPTTSEVGSSNYLQKVTDTKDKQGNGKFVVLHLRFDKVCLLVVLIPVVPYSFFFSPKLYPLFLLVGQKMNCHALFLCSGTSLPCTIILELHLLFRIWLPTQLVTLVEARLKIWLLPSIDKLYGREGC